MHSSCGDLVVLATLPIREFFKHIALRGLIDMHVKYSTFNQKDVFRIR